MKSLPNTADEARAWMKAERESRNWSTTTLARVARDAARREGDKIALTQQSISGFEQPGKAKRVPVWLRYVALAFEEGAEASADLEELPEDRDQDDVEIQQWDISYGMGGGAFNDLPVTGDRHKFSRSWLRQFTHAPPDKIFLAVGTGDSMTPTILDSDIVVIDTSQHEVRMADRIWAAAYGQTGIIKRLRPMPDGSVKILSDNPAVSAETAYDGELAIVGRVVAIVRKT
jgi:phage repressor protein C with HTH and peptisase S24 domain